MRRPAWRPRPRGLSPSAGQRAQQLGLVLFPDGVRQFFKHSILADGKKERASVSGDQDFSAAVQIHVQEVSFFLGGTSERSSKHQNAVGCIVRQFVGRPLPALNVIALFFQKQVSALGAINLGRIASGITFAFLPGIGKEGEQHNHRQQNHSSPEQQPPVAFVEVYLHPNFSSWLKVSWKS